MGHHAKLNLNCEKSVETNQSVTQLKRILPNSRFANLPNPAIDRKIWKALYSGSYLSMFVVCRNAGYNPLIPL